MSPEAELRNTILRLELVVDDLTETIQDLQHCARETTRNRAALLFYEEAFKRIYHLLRKP